MQIAILLVLVLIAILIAPWLLGVIAVAVVSYGLYVVAVGALAVLIALVVFVWFLIKGINSTKEQSKPLIGERKICRHCQCEIEAKARICSNCSSSVA